MRRWLLPLTLAVSVGWICGARCVARPPGPRAAIPERLPLPAIHAALDACGSAILRDRERLDAVEGEVRGLRARVTDVRCVVTHQWERVGKPVARLTSWSEAWGDWAQCSDCPQGYQCNRAKER